MRACVQTTNKRINNKEEEKKIDAMQKAKSVKAKADFDMAVLCVSVCYWQ